MQVVLSKFSEGFCCFVPTTAVCRYGYMNFLAALELECVDVMLMSSS